jgi:hypothetical protein
MSASSSLSASTKRAIARIRRLCGLGLGGQITVPELVGELHTLIPSTNNYFMWAGSDLELANFYGEGDILRTVPLFLVSFSTSASRKLSSPSPKGCGGAEKVK